jgi:prolyl oligopeptidase
MKISIKPSLFWAFQLATLSLFAQPLVYPETRKTDQRDIYHGVTVEDPYRWLEEDRSLETKKWVTLQNELTQGYLSGIPFRDSLEARMRGLWTFLRFSTPIRCGSSYFYYRSDGVQNQPLLFYMKSLENVPYAWFDPNKLSENGTTALTQTVPSPDGKYVAFQVSEAGSDWNSIRVKDVKTLKALPEVISRVKFSGIAWFKDGFYYSAYDSTGDFNSQNKNHKVYYHRLNTPASKDSLVWEDAANPLRNFQATVSDDERFLIISGSESTSGNSLFIQDLQKAGSRPVAIVKDFAHDFDFIGNTGNQLLFLTNFKAERKKVVSIDATNLVPGAWKDVVPEQKDILQGAVMTWKSIVLHYLKNASSALSIYDLKGQMAREIPLDGPGTVEGLSGSAKDTMLFYSLTTFTRPAQVFRYNMKTHSMGIQFRTQLSYNPEDYETRQVFYTSKDGTRIPMFIVHKKGLKPDGKTPTLLFGYGGFNISKTPEFKPERLVFLEQGGIFAMPSLRGGGEFGTAWHKAGTRLQKQNVFDDFIAAAEYLIKEGYTNPAHLAISGRSNGGLLVGAVMAQRPELFKVALPAVGVMDMLRFQKFTIGWAWTGDYGSSDNADEFQALYAYSPLHNLKAGVTYPATLVTTADHDDRVVPGHSFKFTARLQEVHTGENPVLIRIDVDAGHGAGKPTGKLIQEQSDFFAFMMYQLGMKY